ALSIGVEDGVSPRVELGPLDGRITHRHKDNVVTYSAGFDNLDAQAALRLARRLAATEWIEERWGQELDQFSASGLIKLFDVSLQLNEPAQWNWQKAEVQSSLVFEKLSVLHQNPDTGQRAGFENLSGQLSGDNQSGSWKLSGSNSRIVLEELFPEKVLAFDTLKGQGSWSMPQGLEQGITFAFNDLSAQNSDLHALLRGEYQFAQGRSDQLNIQGLLKRAEIAQIPGYLPSVLGTQVRAWLDNNLKGGVVKDATFLANGPVQEFPFHDSANEDHQFEIKIPVSKAQLTFAPDWPLIEAIEGQVMISGRTLKVQADSAKTNQVDLSDVQVVIDNLAAPQTVLNIQGLAKGELAQLLAYTRASPVGGFIGGALAQSEAVGQASLDLSLTVPLADTRKTSVTGVLNFERNRLRVVREMPWVSNLEGQVSFSDTGLQLSNVRGQALGHPLSVNGGTGRRGLIIQANGVASDTELAKYLSPFLKPYLKGQTA
ncbi:MAG: DUF3971 domain-containing protein, partial [Limnobacter sp.]|nr:DUF3971 domain-containing protein [Limnobacter sp.]